MNKTMICYSFKPNVFKIFNYFFKLNRKYLIKIIILLDLDLNIFL